MSAASKSKIELNKPLEKTIQSLIKQFPSIPVVRKTILAQLTDFVEAKSEAHQKIELVFICTHNSRRSHISQIWAQAAAAYYGVKNVLSYSGGTEATAFNPRAVRAMKVAGFRIDAPTESTNPIYKVSLSDKAQEEIFAFSKRYDDDSNPKEGFAAIMTCSHADENCPVISGMEKRISLPYDDPKDFDGTPQENEKYSERVMEIGKEILFAFSQVKAG